MKLRRHPTADLVPFRPAGCRDLGDCVRDGRTSRHTTHNTDRRRVEYRWHPLSGRELLIEGEFAGPKGGALRCSLPDQESRQYCFQVPRWMFDRVHCERMSVGERPRVAWEALVSLRELLEDTRRHRYRDVPNRAEMVSTEGGHADETQPPPSQRKPARTVSTASSSHELGRSPRTEQAKASAPAVPDDPGSRRTNRCRPAQRRCGR